MGKKYKYKIGDWVSFKKYIKVNSYDGERFANEIEFSKYKFGQICGATTRYLGEIKNHDWDYHNNEAYLSIKKSITLYQVKEGMINAPYEVKEEDLTIMDYLDIHGAFISGKIKTKGLPWKKSTISNWSREALSKEAKEAPRNSKGQFI